MEDWLDRLLRWQENAFRADADTGTSFIAFITAFKNIPNPEGDRQEDIKYRFNCFADFFSLYLSWTLSPDGSAEFWPFKIKKLAFLETAEEPTRRIATNARFLLRATIRCLDSTKIFDLQTWTEAFAKKALCFLRPPKDAIIVQRDGGSFSLRFGGEQLPCIRKAVEFAADTEVLRLGAALALLASSMRGARREARELILMSVLASSPEPRQKMQTFLVYAAEQTPELHHAIACFLSETSWSSCSTHLDSSSEKCRRRVELSDGADFQEEAAEAFWAHILSQDVPLPLSIDAPKITFLTSPSHTQRIGRGKFSVISKEDHFEREAALTFRPAWVWDATASTWSLHWKFNVSHSDKPKQIRASFSLEAPPQNLTHLLNKLNECWDYLAVLAVKAVPSAPAREVGKDYSRAGYSEEVMKLIQEHQEIYLKNNDQGTKRLLESLRYDFFPPVLHVNKIEGRRGEARRVGARRKHAQK